MLALSPLSTFTQVGSPPAADQPAEEIVDIHPALAAATSPPILNFARPLSPHCTEEAAYGSDGIVSSSPLNPNPQSSSLYFLPSSPQRRPFLIDIRSCTP